MEGHTGRVRGVCPVTVGDRQLLASAGDKRTVRIWDPDIAQCLTAIPVHHLALAIAHVKDAIVVGLSAGLLAIELTGPAMTST